MGKKKAFIDKKKAVTYSLVYRDPAEDADGDDGGIRTLAPAGGHRGGGQEPEGYQDYYEDDMSLYESEYSLAMSRDAASHHDPTYTLTEERRRELLALGFPDDGYDYLRHLRDLGRARPGAAPPGGIETIPEDQELEGFEEPADEDDEDGMFPDDGAEDDEDDFTIYDEPPLAEGPVTSAAKSAPAKLDAVALAAVAAAAAAGPSTFSAAAAAGAVSAVGSNSGAHTAGGSRPAANGSAAGPGPGSSARPVAPSATGRGAGGGGRSVMTARSVASTARSQGSGVGPSVFLRPTKLVAPTADVKVVDARRLVVQPRGHDEAAAAAALSEVSALARPKQLHGTRGKLYQDLEELEKSMAAVENGNDPNRDERVEGDEWADWLDEFVAGGGEDDAAGAAAGGSAAAGQGGGESEEEERGGDSEEPEAEDEDELRAWQQRHHRTAGQQDGTLGREATTAAGAVGTAALGAIAHGAFGARGRVGPSGAGPAAPVAGTVGGPVSVRGGGAAGGGAAVSVASSYWRPERRDRKEALEALDAQFERLAIEYEDNQIGALNGDDDDDQDDGDYDAQEYDERYGSDAEVFSGDEGAGANRRGAPGRGGKGRAVEAAAGTCELSDFADVLDEFLTEHRTAEALEAEGLKPLKAVDDVALQASQPDPAALAATLARVRRQMEAAGEEDEPAETKQTIVLPDADRWDCESILSLTSNLENHPAKIVEPQRRTGGRGGGLIRLSAKTGMPLAAAALGAGRGGSVAPIPEEGAAVEEEEDEVAQGEGGSSSDEGSEGGQTCGGSVLDPAALQRRKGETAEERRARKAAVKEARRAQRTAKKEMKTLFRQQATKAQKQVAGKSVSAGSTYVIP